MYNVNNLFTARSSVDTKIPLTPISSKKEICLYAFTNKSVLTKCVNPFVDLGGIYLSACLNLSSV